VSSTFVHLQVRNSSGQIIFDKKIDRFPVTIGRAPENDIVLTGPSVSGRHARVERTEQGYVLEDLGSSNGTMLAGERVTTHEFSGKTAVVMGTMELVFIPEASAVERTLMLEPGVRPAASSLAPAAAEPESSGDAPPPLLRGAGIRKRALIAAAAGLVFVMAAVLAARPPWADDVLSAVGLSGSGGLSKRAIARVTAATFEIVVPKIEDEFVTYKEPLPFDLLPFKERNDKFIGLGTAFAIEGGRFVSAAHVFNIHQKTLFGPFHLRDQAGKTYSVARFTGYSQYRDLAVFTIENPPESVEGLRLHDDHKAGDVVYAVGNAQGEGIAIRSGDITSYTPEAVSGAWNFIRFSAAASPGNSGGPLLNSRGRVVGVVSMKNSNENLNYAVPVRELSNLPADKAEFFIKGMSEVESGQRYTEDWRFAAKLPAAPAELAEDAQKQFYAQFDRMRKKFEEKFAPEIFPKHKGVETFLREQPEKFILGEIDANENGVWSTRYPELKFLEYEGQTKIFFGGVSSDQWVVIVERPDKASLKDFYDNPQLAMDTACKSLELHRTFAGKRIPIQSLGKAHTTEVWRDELGRPWRTYVWRTSYSNTAHILNCLTYPRGLACHWHLKPVSKEQLVHYYAKVDAKRVAFSYDGRLSDWAEYLALPDEYKPSVFSGARLTREKDRLELELASAKAAFSLPELSEKSLLYVGVGFDPADRARQIPMSVGVRPRHERQDLYRVQSLYEPTERSSESYVGSWTRISKREAPFDGRTVKTGETLERFHVSEPEGGRELAAEKPFRMLRFHSCSSHSGLSPKAFAKVCDGFLKGWSWR
jgi:S1-C subfamily serine protease